MSNRRGSGGFSSSFTRRPGAGSGNDSSILGDPPRRSQQQLYDPFAESERDSGRSYGRGGGDPYDRHGGSSSGYNTATYSSSSSAQVGYGGQASYGTPSQSQFSTPVVMRDSSSTWRRRSPSPPPHHHTDSGYSRGRQSPTWSGQQSRGFAPSGSAYKASGGSMGMSGQQGQQLVMVMPQGQAGSTGLMGMMPVTPGPNPFGQRQAPMQVILGNLPAFNPNIFDQQQLMASGGGPFGNNPQMGAMMNSNMQRSSGHSRSSGTGAYGRESQRSSLKDRFGRSSASVRQRSSLGSTSSVSRRSDSNRNNTAAVHRGGRSSLGGGNSSSTMSSRGGRKRGVSDRLAEDLERKKAKLGNQARDRVVRTSIGQPNSTPNKAGNKTGGYQNRKKGDNKNKNGQTPGKPKTPTSILKKSGDKPAVADKNGTAKDNKKKPSEDKPAVSAEEKPTVKPDGDASEVIVLGDNGEATDKKTEETKGEGEKKAEEKKKSKYDEFPPGLLVCKVCQKTMNDGGSYESHLNGRAHAALVKIVESRFQKRAELLMYESKLNEEEIGVEIDRQRRSGKSTTGAGSKNKNHCKMCDCNYTVNWGTHKISLGHRILKEFLHPTCRFCDTQFVHRMDWLNHLFSLTHLRRLYEIKAEGKDLKEQESPTQDELFSISLEMNSEEHPTNFITIRNSDWKVPSKDDLKELLQEDNGQVVIPEGEIIIPKEHDENFAVGEDTIIQTTGFCCKVCRIYLTQEKEVLPHCQNKSHFGMYCAYLKRMVKLKEAIKKEEEEAAAAAIAAAEAAELERKKAEEKAQKDAEDKSKIEAGEKVESSGAAATGEVIEVEKKNPVFGETAVVDLGDEEEGDGAHGDSILDDHDMFTVEDEVGGDEEMDTEPAGAGVPETDEAEAKDEKKTDAEVEVDSTPAVNDVEMAEAEVTAAVEKTDKPEANDETKADAKAEVDEATTSGEKPEGGLITAESTVLQSENVSVEKPELAKTVEPEKVESEKKEAPSTTAAAPVGQNSNTGIRGVPRGVRGASTPRGNHQGQGQQRGRGFQQNNRGVRGGGGGPGQQRGRGSPIRRPGGNAGPGGARGVRGGRGRPY